MTQNASELRDRLPQSDEQYGGIFEDTVTNNTRVHVIVSEDEIGRFYKAVRELGLEADTFRPTTAAGALRGYVE